MPDPNELGWKDTVRISPLEDTIVALRPVAPKLPFGIPDSVRRLNPALPANSTEGFTSLDPFTAQPKNPPTTNVPTNLGWEYVWHCHILSHEEADMMRIIKLEVAVDLPAAPTLTRVGTTSPVVLSWNDATTVGPDPANPANLGNPANEIGFRVERAVVNGPTVEPWIQIGKALANQTTFTDNSPASTSTYRYRVVAYNAAGSSPSNEIDVASATPPPIAPSGLSATVQGGQVLLAWTDNSSNETGFRIQRSTNNTFTANLVAFNAAAGATSYPDSSALQAGLRYYYRVMAVNGTVLSAPSNVVSVQVGTLAAPTNLTLSLLRNPIRVRLVWQDNATTNEGFLVERSTDSAFTAPTLIPVAGADTTSFTEQVAAGSVFYYRVRATIGNPVTDQSGPSNVRLASPPAAPTNMIVTQAAGATNIVVRFTDNADNESGFILERSTDGGTTWALKANLGIRGGTPPQTVTYTDQRATFTPGMVMKYRVRATNALGDSATLTQTGTLTAH
jgi:hypothetical protein